MQVETAELPELATREAVGLSWAGAAALGAFTTAYLSYQQRENEQEGHADGDGHHLLNWSGTHECNPRHFWEPHSVEEVEDVVAKAHKEGAFLAVSGLRRKLSKHLSLLRMPKRLLVTSAYD